MPFIILLSLISKPKSRSFFIAVTAVVIFATWWLPHSLVFILDGGHNEGCIKALRAMAEKYLKGKKLTFLIAFMKDKDYTSALSDIAPMAENIVFTLTDPIRGEAPEVLKTTAESYCKNVFSVCDPAEAYNKALSLSAEDSVLIVTGSFYLVSDIRNKLSQ